MGLFKSKKNLIDPMIDIKFKDKHITVLKEDYSINNNELNSVFKVKLIEVYKLLNTYKKNFKEYEKLSKKNKLTSNDFCKIVIDKKEYEINLTCENLLDNEVKEKINTFAEKFINSVEYMGVWYKKYEDVIDCIVEDIYILEPETEFIINDYLLKYNIKEKEKFEIYDELKERLGECIKEKDSLELENNGLPFYIKMIRNKTNEKPKGKKINFEELEKLYLDLNGYSIVDSKQIKDNMYSMGYYSYAGYVYDIINRVLKNVIIKDYKSQFELIKDKEISSLTIQEIQVYFTYISRGERFCEGFISGFLKDGTFKKLYERFLELKKEDGREPWIDPNNL